MATSKTKKPTKKGTTSSRTKTRSTNSRSRSQNTKKNQNNKKKTRVIETPNKWKRQKQKKRLQVAAILCSILVVIGTVFQFLEYRKEVAYRKEGIEFFQEQQYKKAQKQFEQGLKHRNIFGISITKDIRYYLAESYFLDGAYEKALNVYQEISRSEKNSGYVSCYIGACYAKLGDEKKAKEQFEESIELGNEEGYHYLSKMYYDLEQYEKAIEYERKFMELREPDGAAYMLLAKCYSSAGKFEKAIKAVEAGIALDDDKKQELLFEEVVIYEKKLDFESAYEKCLKYVTSYPEDTIAKQELEFLETR